MSKPEMKAFFYMRVNQAEVASERQETASQAERTKRITERFGPPIVEFVEDNARQEPAFKAIGAGGQDA